VKKFHQHVGRLDDKEFDNEVLNLRKIQHQNIVRLLGYCYVSQHTYVEHNGATVRAEHIERLLCFEYMQGGSLDKHISGIPLFAENFHVCKWFSSFKILSVLFSIVDESCDLDSPTNYKIIRGICEGLNHLHTAKYRQLIILT
jgi:interleukin-1 receptor-associated kinase 1